MKKLQILQKRKLASALKKLNDWSANSKGTEIEKTFKFNRYVDGLVFIARVAVHAEVLNHHPDIRFQADKVTVKLQTHSVKGVTSLDIDLATRIEHLSA